MSCPASAIESPRRPTQFGHQLRFNIPVMNYRHCVAGIGSAARANCSLVWHEGNICIPGDPGGPQAGPLFPRWHSCGAVPMVLLCSALKVLMTKSVKWGCGGRRKEPVHIVFELPVRNLLETSLFEQRMALLMYLTGKTEVQSHLWSCLAKCGSATMAH